MTKYLVVILSLLSFQALAIEADPPPLRYNHPYPGKLYLYKLPFDQVQAACKQTSQVYGCARRNDKECVVYISNNTNMTVSSLLRHELAHCNGWGNPFDAHPK